MPIKHTENCTTRGLYCNVCDKVPCKHIDSLCSSQPPEQPKKEQEKKIYQCLNTRHRETGLSFPCERCVIKSSQPKEDWRERFDMSFRWYVVDTENGDGDCEINGEDAKEDILSFISQLLEEKLAEQKAELIGDWESFAKRNQEIGRQSVLKEIEKIAGDNGIMTSDDCGYSELQELIKKIK